MIYEWVCHNCGDLVTIHSSIADRDIPPTNTLYCDKEHTQPHSYKRILASPRFSLLGSGWAKDGYSKENKK